MHNLMSWLSRYLAPQKSNAVNSGDQKGPRTPTRRGDFCAEGSAELYREHSVYVLEKRKRLEQLKRCQQRNRRFSILLEKKIQACRDEKFVSKLRLQYCPAAATDDRERNRNKNSNKTSLLGKLIVAREMNEPRYKRGRSGASPEHSGRGCRSLRHPGPKIETWRSGRYSDGNVVTSSKRLQSRNATLNSKRRLALFSKLKHSQGIVLRRRSQNAKITCLLKSRKCATIC
mmetsp:Transcript_26288/g.36632  ORF Transcript_26288/g.36632 Transcript_26288/m.36632 type:complete len:230 (+) Transcript_26288:130-819(+)